MGWQLGLRRRASPSGTFGRRSLSAYAQAGCERVYLWPLGEERRQIELVAQDVVPRIET